MNALVFIFAWALAFFIPGDNFLKPLKLEFFPRLVLGTILGITLWALSGFIFGWLGARWLTYPYLIANLLFWLKFNLGNLKIPSLDSQKIDGTVPLIIIGGSIFSLTAVWFMGTKLDGGLFFCCRGVPDGLYHLALTNQLVKNFPPFEPGSFDVAVKNYHLLSNLVIADLSRIFKLDIISLHFRYISLLLALLLGSCSFILSDILKLKTTLAKWLALFLYASGDILYLLLFLRERGLNFDVTILDDATKLLAGPPRAFSIVLFFGALCFLAIAIKRRKPYALYLSALIFGSLIGFKVYTGIFTLIGFGFLGLYFLLKRRLAMILPLVVALILSLAIYLPTNSGAGGIKFNGFWRFENFIEHKDLKIEKLEYLRLQSVSKGNHLPAYIYEILFIVIYFTFLFGTVNLGLLQTKKSLSQIPAEINIFLISGLVTTTILGSFFVQQTGGANTIQFTIGAFIIGGFYAALAVYWWTSKFPKSLAIITVILLILGTSVRGIHEVFQNINFIKDKSGVKVTKAEMEGLLYLRDNSPKQSKILMSEFMSEEQLFIYVSYFADRPLFLASAGLLRDHGFDTSEKQEAVKKVMTSTDEASVKELLVKNNINYLYFHSELPATIRNNEKFLPKVFGNEKVNIFRVI